jgi:hypothetical protein
MKFLPILLAGALVSCSSISKETYTERRILTYPKKSTPHIKDMYLQEPKTQTHQIIQHPEPQAETPVADFDYINPDLPTNDTITIGSTKQDVAGVLGSPTKVQKGVDTDMWWYKSSYIVFDSAGQVEGYSENGTPLKISIQ